MKGLWETPKSLKEKRKQEQQNKELTTTKIKLGKGQTIDTLIISARNLVEEKLGKYKDTSKCVIFEKDLIDFFNQTPADGVVGIDTETTGLDVLTDKLVGISVCNGKSCLYIPVNHISYVSKSRISTQIDIDRLKEIFGNVFKEKPNIKWVYHNAKFDLGVLRTFFGYPVPKPYWDTMLASCLFNQDEEHSLKFQYNKYIATEDEGVNRFDNLFKGITFDIVPIDVATIYAGKDAFMTFELYEYQKSLMEKRDFEGIKYVMENIEMPLLPILEDMHRIGVNMNQGMINDLYEKFSIKLEEAKVKVYEEIDKYKDQIDRFRREHYDIKLDDPINIASPLQLSTLFYKIIGYKTKSGKGTGEAELNEINTPLTLALIDYRKMSKLIDAFLVSLPKRLNPVDNKIHTSLNQYGAATGRFSSSDPNLQQIPSRGVGKDIRKIFGASKGYILMSSDFSQQEPRCLASLSGDVKMQEAYMIGKDLYATMASDIYKMPYADCMEFYLDENGKKTDKTNPEGKKRRSATKSILLGIMYGRGVPSIAEQINSTPEEAQKIIDDFYEAFPTIKKYTEYVQETAKRDGYTTTAWGRRRYLKHIQDEMYEFKYNDARQIDFNPLFTSTGVINKEVSQDIKDYYISKLEKTKNSYMRNKIIEDARKDGITIINNQSFIAEAKRQCLNSVIQGSSADMSKKAMILLGNNEELKSLGFRMLFPVHDEVIAECPFENRKRCAELMSQLMIQSGADKISVPMKCDVEAFFYWYGPDVALEDNEITQQQYNDYDTTGIYKDEKFYINI